MLIKQIYISFLLLVCIGSTFAQKSVIDSVILLDEVVVHSSRAEKYALGASMEYIDSVSLKSMQMQSLSELLQTNSGSNITSYGIGGLSSVSVRGGGSAHTAVVLNDFNLQSPMNGGFNLSVLPVCLLDNISVQYGGSGSLYGSGAIAGVIHLGNGNLLSKHNSLKLITGIGSFGNRSFAIKAKVGNDKMASSFKAFIQNATNDFEFRNSAKYQEPFEKQTNARLNQYGVFQENMFRTSVHSSLNTVLWIQHYVKDIQTKMTDSNVGTTNQTDNNVFSAVNWKYANNNYSIGCKSGFIFNELLYNNYDPINLEKDDNQSYSFINEVEYKKTISKLNVINIGFNYTREQASSNSYLGNPLRNRFSLFSTYKLLSIWNRLNLALSFREEFLDNHFLPLTYTIGEIFSLSKNVEIRGNVSKNYRIPTFNDLYWESGKFAQGNPALKPESSWYNELGVFATKQIAQTTLEISSNAYYSRIYDWIVWLPNAAGVWKPNNKKEGLSAGFENRLNSRTNLGHLVIMGINLLYAYSYSKILESGDEYNKHSMIYVPKHRIMAFQICTEFFQ